MRIYRLTLGALTVAFLGIAALSAFELPPAINVNLDVSLMLTPFGILRFLVFSDSHPLAPYYFHETVREGCLDHPWLTIPVLLVVGLALFALYLNFRRSKRRFHAR